MRAHSKMLAVALALVLVALPARAQSLQLIRDAEIEATIAGLARPIFEAAGIAPSGVDIYLVRDDRLNAFVAGGQNLFLYTGLLMRADDPAELAGVIAHEAGHIAGGHLVRLADAAEDAAVEQILGLVLGAAAAAAGAPQVGGAIAMGGQGLAQESMLRYSRAQEQAADQAAVTYLDRTGIGATGLRDFFEILDQKRMLSGVQPTPYLQTHPLTRDRITFVARHADADDGAALGPDARERHARMVAKLQGFLEPPARVREELAGRDDLAARYGRAVATYRLNDVEGALREVRALIEAEPDNPYFHELEGQIRFETGDVAAAVGPYREAVRLAPSQPLLRLGLGRALLQSGAAAEAVGPLEEVVRAEPRNAFAWRRLGIARGRAGDLGASNLALAEAAILQRELADAGLYLSRAEERVSSGHERQQLADLQRALEDARERAR
ncbi:MAG: M48 family metalloprotease [Alphaproteobacteria bacterium]|nr:M48 family metalloprotease [Alphaproteobacteria bacterium]